MNRLNLSDTLTALIEGVTPDHPMIAIEEAEISLPLLIRVEYGPDGPVFLAQPPYSAFRCGIEPVTHPTRIRIEAVATEAATPTNPATSDPAG